MSVPWIWIQMFKQNYPKVLSKWLNCYTICYHIIYIEMMLSKIDLYSLNKLNNWTWTKYMTTLLTNISSGFSPIKVYDKVFFINISSCFFHLKCPVGFNICFRVDLLQILHWQKFRFVALISIIQIILHSVWS